MRIRRPALVYKGGKWRIAPWIISYFPPHFCYVEPFGGGASVLLRKAPAVVEVYNDINGDVVNFFDVLRERPADLIAAIDLTPYSRAELARARESCTDPVERARRFYVVCGQGRKRGGVDDPGGWRFTVRKTRGTTAVEDWNNHHHLWAVVRRLKEVHFECLDALRVIELYDDPGTLFYLDPPYVPDSRGEGWDNCAYTHEYTVDDHRELARALFDLEGMAVLSGYPSVLYDELYADWARVEREENKGDGGQSLECLWISPRAMEARLPLFSQVGVFQWHE